jgi:integrase
VLERRDVDKTGRVLSVRRTLSDGEVVELAKTSASRRQVPLSRRALEGVRGAAAAAQPAAPVRVAGGQARRRRQLSSPRVVAGDRGVEVAKPARLYDLRSTFASNALAGGVTVFELARLMGTSVRMIEKHYGTLLEGAHAGLVTRLDALEAELAEAARDEAEAAD